MLILPWLLSFMLLHATSAWAPTELGDRSTLDFLTVGSEEGEHWSTVWFVLIDGDVYLRLGQRAAKRIDQNTTAPRLQIRAAGIDARPMRYEKVPDKATAVGLAMRQKYWSDVLGEPFRRLGLTSPTMTLRLVAEHSRVVESPTRRPADTIGEKHG